MNRIVSAIPGRIRLRDPRLRERAPNERLRARLAALEGVRSVVGNPATGGLLLHYDATRVDRAAMESGVEAAAASELAPGAPPVPNARPRAAAARAGAVVRLERKRPPGDSGPRSEWETTGHVERRGRPHSARALARQLNGYAKLGMIGSLGASLALAAAGSKRLHIATGGLYLAFLAMHMAVHRRHLLK